MPTKIYFLQSAVACELQGMNISPVEREAWRDPIHLDFSFTQNHFLTTRLVDQWAFIWFSCTDGMEIS